MRIQIIFATANKSSEPCLAAVNEMLVNNEPGSAVIEGGRDCHCGSPSQLEVVVNDVAAADAQ